MNTAKTQEAGFMAAALKMMVKRRIAIYKHGGVELARIPGSEKLRVRMTTEKDEDLSVVEEQGQAAGESGATTGPTNGSGDEASAEG